MLPYLLGISIPVAVFSALVVAVLMCLWSMFALVFLQTLTDSEKGVIQSTLSR